MIRHILRSFLFSSAVLGAVPVVAAPMKPDERQAFVLVSLRTAIHETKYLDECPTGVAIGNDEIWWKSLSPLDRDRLTNGGQTEPAARRRIAERRGPNGENVCWRPDVVIDPPLRTVKGAVALGRNLDGRTDGAATPNTCAHQDFQGLNGEPGVDNQLYRLLGCIYGWRSDGYIEGVADTERTDSSKGVWLIEITPLDQGQPAQRVKVDFYRIVDMMRKDVKGDILPYASYRVDHSPLFRHSVTGTLTGGKLVTDPADVRLPFYGNRVSTEMELRGMSLDLAIADDGARADGLLTGYHDLDNWWDYVRKMGYLIDTAQFSCPALYTAAQQLADGYPDPETGDCTALSAAYTVSLLPAFVNRSGPRPDEGIYMQPPNSLPAEYAPSPEDALKQALPHHPNVFTSQPGPMGHVLADLQGRTLYVADAAMVCDAACSEKWRPAEAAWVSVPTGDWSVVTRPDQTLQWAYRDQPLYTCAADPKPNVATCEGEGWHAVVLSPAADAPAWVTRQETIVGKIFADTAGHTLYVMLGEREVFEREVCDAACIDALWRPVPAAADAQPVGDWAVVSDNAGMWWTYRGRKVHTYAEDELPGQINGHLFGGASVSAQHYWTALPPEIADLASPRQNRPIAATEDPPEDP